MTTTTMKPIAMKENELRTDDSFDELTAKLMSDLSIGKLKIFVRASASRIVPLSDLAEQNSVRERVIITGRCLG